LKQPKLLKSYQTHQQNKNTPNILHSSTDSFPETLEVGSNTLAGTDPNKILEAAKVSYAQKKTWANPFGDGKTGSRIINILRGQLK
jgi:UDP-N-acetylglucosamine 2-epimerase (non-hydrolysing)